VLLIAERDDDGKAGDDVMSPSPALHCTARTAVKVVG
jgi:hypothetical protein